MLNLATGAVLMLTCCFIMYVVSVFFTPPYGSLPAWLNPLPPPTLPPIYVLPTPSEADLIPTNAAPLPTQPPVVPTATLVPPTEAAPTDVPPPTADPAMEEGSMDEGGEGNMEEAATPTPIIGSGVEDETDSETVPTIGVPPTDAAPTDAAETGGEDTTDATAEPTAVIATPTTNADATEGPTEAPTGSETATATETVAPTQTEAASGGQPGATPTFSAFPFTLQDNGIQYTSFPGGCSFMGVAGQVFDLQGAPILGSSIEISGGAVDGSQSITGTATDYGAGGYEIKISDSTEDTVDVYAIRLYNENGAPLSDEIPITTSDSCDNNLILVNFVQNR